MNKSDSRTAKIRQLARSDETQARIELVGLLAELFQIEATDLAINHDQYSLNSLNGFFETKEGSFFFKFHQEEGEEDMVGEYYRADILANANLPVDKPVYVSNLPGEQILVYRRSNNPRFSDVLRELDFSDDTNAQRIAVAAEGELNAKLLQVCRKTLHPITSDEACSEPIHHLFFERMVDPKSGVIPGGRYENFYVGKTFKFPGVTLTWEEFSNAKLVLNGVRYRRTISELFDESSQRLNPVNLAGSGGVVAHGDAHNANVWFEKQTDSARLSFFDPAFAGYHIPSLLAEVKATFHNVMAHPLWLYEPDQAAEKFTASSSYNDGVLCIDTNWKMSSVRKQLLDVKANVFWEPFLAILAERDLLPDDWETEIRLALFLCPTLVMNLRANADRHNEISSAIGFLVAATAGSTPETGEDLVSEFFQKIAPRDAVKN
ncbi:MAG: hypothetical protein AB8B94_06725 [Hyphomicrobiales bacterium]